MISWALLCRALFTLYEAALINGVRSVGLICGAPMWCACGSRFAFNATLSLCDGVLMLFVYALSIFMSMRMGIARVIASVSIGISYLVGGP